MAKIRGEKQRYRRVRLGYNRGRQGSRRSKMETQRRKICAKQTQTWVVYGKVVYPRQEGVQ